MALPTRGRVIIETTVGELDIELWSREAPNACRNFLALAMEGYYDGVIFHRVVPNFLVQTGDRTGTGAGGESFFGEPFEDEIHPRLRFSHRGLVAYANNGTKDSNDSQFFITLDRADELHGKHTLFGRCVGDTIFNVLKIGGMELDENERPLYPPKINTVRIIDNPFDDIVPRITAEEKRIQQRAREQAQREREEQARRKGAKKDVKLLSFGQDEDAGEEELVTFKKKAIVRPDLVDDPSVLPSIPESIMQIPSSGPSKPSRHESETKVETNTEKSRKKDKDEGDVTKLREKHEKEQAAKSNSRQAEIQKMEAEIRKLQRRREGGEDSDEERARKKAKNTSYLDEELAKYSKGRGIHRRDGKKKDEGDILAALSSFRSKLKSLSGEDERAGSEGAAAQEGGSETKAEGEEEGIEVDNDISFIGHSLHFPKDNSEEVRKAERDYEVIDPRQRGAMAKEEERQRRLKSAKGKSGNEHRGRGYRR